MPRMVRITATNTSTFYSSVPSGTYATHRVVGFLFPLAHPGYENKVHLLDLGSAIFTMVKDYFCLRVPKALVSILNEALADDDADFMEQCVLEAFEQNDPVYIIGASYYTTRKNFGPDPEYSADCALADSRRGPQARALVR